MNQASIRATQMLLGRPCVYFVFLCLVALIATPALAAGARGRSYRPGPSEQWGPRQDWAPQWQLRPNLAPPLPLVLRPRTPTLAEEGRAEEERKIRSELSGRQLEDLQIVLSPTETDPNRLVVKLRTTRPLPRLRRGRSDDSSVPAYLGAGRTARPYRFSLGAELPVETLVKEAIANTDRGMLETLDRLVLSRDKAQAVEWNAPVRILEYSKTTETLTVRPPEPLLYFQIRMSPSGHEPGAMLREAQLREFIRRSEGIVHEGDTLPAHVARQLSWLDRIPVAHSRYSANQTPEQITRALRLGEKGFAERPALILDGLPEPQPGLRGAFQLWKMKLGIFSGGAWRRLRIDLSFEMLGKTTTVHKMNESALLRELQQGDENMLVLIAHNAEGRIYFPDGTSIDMQKIAQLERKITPDRAVVLITCEAGGTGGNVPSLAETILKNRLAAAVFASPEVIDASKLPTLLRDLLAKPLRDALRSYQIDQYVGLKRRQYG